MGDNENDGESESYNGNNIYSTQNAEVEIDIYEENTNQSGYYDK